MPKKIPQETRNKIRKYVEDHTWKETSSKFDVSEMTIKRILDEKPKNETNGIDTELLDKLVLLMVKARINSSEFGIDIKESEIEPSINRLKESGKI